MCGKEQPKHKSRVHTAYTRNTPLSTRPWTGYVPFFFFKVLFIYSIEIETASERGNTSRGSERGRSRLIVEEPEVGLDPITPGSRPEPKADA